MVLWPFTQQILTFLHIFDHFRLKLTLNRMIFQKKIFILHTNRLKKSIKATIKKEVLWPSAWQKLTILCIFNHFRRQIDVNWCQYVCYHNKYSSDTLTDCRNGYKPLWKTLKSGNVAIYTTKIDDFTYFRSFSTLNWHQLTSIWVLSQYRFFL